MQMDTRDFPAQVNEVLSADGFLRDMPLDILAGKTLVGAALAAGSGDTRVVSVETNFLAVQNIAGAGGTADMVRYHAHVPGDYDARTRDTSDRYPGDTITIRVLAAMGGTTDTPALTARVYRKRAGAALSSDLAPTAVTVSGTDAAWYEIDISGNGLQPGDALTVDLYPSSHTTDAFNIFAIAIRYRSVLALYDETART